jgi:AraC-like DNA-binding protein
MKDLDFESGYQTEAFAFKRAECFSENSGRIERTIGYMTQHLNQPLQASDLAAVANISLSHYFVLFKRTTGCGPIDFFIRLRMRRARQLLETTSMTIKEIAGELGYEDPFYFSRLFKSVNGVAPSDYRKAQQNAIDLDRIKVSSVPLRKSAGNVPQRPKRIVTGASPVQLAVPLDITQLSSTYL